MLQRSYRRAMTEQAGRVESILAGIGHKRTDAAASGVVPAPLDARILLL